MPDHRLDPIEAAFDVPGGMNAAMGAHDWAATPLGPLHTWPQPLQILTATMLGSRQPMFITWGPSRTLLYNDGYAPMLGRHHPAALGRSFHEVWAEVWPEVRPLFERVDAGHSVHMDDLALTLHRNGAPEEAHFAFSFAPVRDAAGVVAGLFCTCVETTDTVVAQRRLLADGERLREMFDQAPGFICRLRGPNHVFDLVNQAYLRVVGFRDILGRPLVEAVPEVVGQGFVELLDEVYATGMAISRRRAKIDLRKIAGGEFETLYLDFVYQPLTDPSGAVIGIFVQGHDVTEAKLADDTVRQNAAWLRGLADTIPGYVWGADPAGRISQTTSSWVDEVVGGPSTTLGDGWADFVHPDDLARVTAAWARSVATGALHSIEFRVVGPDGGYRWNLVRASPVRDEAGRITRWVGLNVDIDDQKRAEAALHALNETLEQRVDLAIAEREQAEDALRQAQKMEAIGQLTGGIAHDFNNMLQGVIGSLELLRRRLAQGRIDEAPAVIDLAMQGANRAAALTKRLLGFARRQMLHDRPVLSNDLVAGMAELARGTVGPAVRLRLEFGPGSWPVFCDANQLENALLNLVINARDAMPAGGDLTLSTAEVWLDAAALAGQPGLLAGDYAEIAVTDTGTGMSPEIASRALEPFFTTKPTGQGTGLGLSQIYGFVRQSNGTVRIDSRPGHGTTVRLFLPRHLGARPDDQPAATPVSPGITRATLLLVEDDPTIRSLTAEALADLGCPGGRSLRRRRGLARTGWTRSDRSACDRCRIAGRAQWPAACRGRTGTQPGSAGPVHHRLRGLGAGGRASEPRHVGHRQAVHLGRVDRARVGDSKSRSDPHRHQHVDRRRVVRVLHHGRRRAVGEAEFDVLADHVGDVVQVARLETDFQRRRGVDQTVVDLLARGALFGRRGGQRQ